MYCNFLTHSSVVGPLGGFQISATISSSAVSIGVHTSFLMKVLLFGSRCPGLKSTAGSDGNSRRCFADVCIPFPTEDKLNLIYHTKWKFLWLWLFVCMWNKTAFIEQNLLRKLCKKSKRKYTMVLYLMLPTGPFPVVCIVQIASGICEETTLFLFQNWTLFCLPGSL